MIMTKLKKSRQTTVGQSTNGDETAPSASRTPISTVYQPYLTTSRAAQPSARLTFILSLVSFIAISTLVVGVGRTYMRHENIFQSAHVWVSKPGKSLGNAAIDISSYSQNMQSPPPESVNEVSVGTPHQSLLQLQQPDVEPLNSHTEPDLSDAVKPASIASQISHFSPNDHVASPPSSVDTQRSQGQTSAQRLAGSLSAAIISTSSMNPAISFTNESPNANIAPKGNESNSPSKLPPNVLDEMQSREGAVELYSYSFRYEGRTIKYTICRIYGAAVHKRGPAVTFITSKAVGRNMALIRQECSPPFLEDISASQVSREVLSGLSTGANLSAGLSSANLDVIRFPLSRIHFPHFVQDAMKLIMCLDSLFFETLPDIVSQISFKFRCVQADGSDCPWENDMSSLVPTVLLESRASRLEKDSWMREFLAMLPPKHMNGLTALLLDPSMTLAEPIRVRSLITFKETMYSPVVGLKGGSHLLFELNGLTRSARTECPARVLILNRPPQFNKYLKGGRNLVNVSVLRDEIMKSADRTNVRLIVEEILFEDNSFRDQVQTMQSADVVIATHGAGITNLVFMRTNTLLIEVFPYGYWPDLFEKMARDFQIKYSYYDAKPDMQNLEACIQNYNGEETELYRSAQAYLVNLRTWASHFERTRVRSHKIELFNGKARSVRICLRGQELALWKNDVESMAEYISNDPNVQRCRK